LTGTPAYGVSHARSAHNRISGTEFTYTITLTFADLKQTFHNYRPQIIIPTLLLLGSPQALHNI